MQPLRAPGAKKEKTQNCVVEVLIERIQNGLLTQAGAPSPLLADSHNMTIYNRYDLTYF